MCMGGDVGDRKMLKFVNHVFSPILLRLTAYSKIFLNLSKRRIFFKKTTCHRDFSRARCSRPNPVLVILFRLSSFPQKMPCR